MFVYLLYCCSAMSCGLPDFPSFSSPKFVENRTNTLGSIIPINCDSGYYFPDTDSTTYNMTCSVNKYNRQYVVWTSAHCERM